jgi:hypothetical protein
MAAAEQIRFGTVGFYQAMADALNADPVWKEKGAAITCSMIYRYEPPVDKTFYMNFDGGNVTEVSELDSVDSRQADIVVLGAPENWKAMLRKEVKPATAIATGKLKVKGKQTYLLKNMKSFSHILDVMTALNPAYD